MKQKEVSISTDNKNLGETIEVDIEVSVPENVSEAVEFYGSEEKLLDAITADVARRKANAARPLLRDAEEALDWVTVAQSAAEDYKPGRRGGFGAVTVSKEEVFAAAAEGNMDDLLAMLASRGAKIIS